MPAPYNVTQLENVSSFQDLFIYMNTEITGFFGLLILLATFIIPFSVFVYRYGTLKAFASASWITFLMSIFLNILGLISQIAISGSFALVVISLILLWKGGK
ncbi:MAG: hypothetical protein ACTSWZ_05220 [Candidatus Heimdallarchaeaceae archaeon]